MINYNGAIVPLQTAASNQNRGLLYGDAVFETLKIVNSKVLFLEDHYFRLMASMRIIRMEIPMFFTMEYLEEQIIALAIAKKIQESSRVRITVFRNEGGYYLPLQNTISFCIEAENLQNKAYILNTNSYEVDLYTDFYVAKHLLSTIKTNNKIINITGSIYANENSLDNCLLINESKNVVEALQGNIFMLKGDTLTTPPISEGCLNGVMRKNIILLAKKMEGLEVIEQTISTFDLQKADELFITNVIKGIQPITKYRKKEFQTNFSAKLVALLNQSIS